MEFFSRLDIEFFTIDIVSLQIDRLKGTDIRGYDQFVFDCDLRSEHRGRRNLRRLI